MDGFLLNVNPEWMDMLNLDKKIIYILFTLLFVRCDNIEHKTNEYEKSIEIIGKKEYKSIYTDLQDSINLWVTNRISSYDAEVIYPFKIDSLLCFNSNKNRFISCRHLYIDIPNATSDDLRFVYGEKINDRWYFFKGASIVIPRSIVKNQPINKPLSYQQLHIIALKEIYRGYLKNNGEINEAWFTSHFENAGWCGTCKTTEDFQKSRLENVKTLWLQRDTSQPIKQLPSKTTLP